MTTRLVVFFHSAWRSHWQGWGNSGFSRMARSKTGCKHDTSGCCFGLKPDGIRLHVASFPQRCELIMDPSDSSLYSKCVFDSYGLNHYVMNGRISSSHTAGTPITSQHPSMYSPQHNTSCYNAFTSWLRVNAALYMLSNLSVSPLLVTSLISFF